jgi:serine/threonine-protein kinase
VNSRQTNPPQSGAVPPERSSLAGKYQLLATLGQGGMADVYLAVARGPLGFNKLVVLKRLRTQADDEGQTLQMFLDEARLAARLNHPNIVDTYDVGREADSYFIAMEYLDGQPLSRVLKATKRGGVHPTVWVHIVAEALHGLHHAHELKDYDGKSLQIVHRDVSPHNIFVTYEAEVKVVDFGIAKATLNVSQTEAGLLKGKIGYMPPEQALGQDVDRRADIFSTGVVLWEALSGRRLLEGGMATVFAKLVHSDVPRLLEVKPDIDPRLASIVDRALKKRPADRFATAAEMREALLQYLRLVPDAAGKSDVARMMATVFAEQRAAVQKEVEKHLATAVRSSAPQTNFWDSTKMLVSDNTSTAMTATPSGDASRPVQTATRVPVASGAGSVTHAASATTVPRQDFSPTRLSRTKLIGVLAAVAVAAGVAGTFALRVDHKAAPAATATRAAETPLAVTLETDPSGALVSWNGQAMGHTPVTIDLPRGTQTLVLSKQGYSTEPIVLDLTGAGGPLSRIITLRAEPEAAVPVNTGAPTGTRRSGLVSQRGGRGSRHEPTIEPTRPAIPEPPPAVTHPESTAPATPPPAVTPVAEAPPAPTPPPAAPEPTPKFVAPPSPAPGTIDKAALAAVFNAHSGEIQACRDRALMDRPDLHGRMTVQATISPTGRVLSASANNAIEGGARLQSCIISAFQSWTFPAPAGGVNGAVAKTFIFE